MSSDQKRESCQAKLDFNREEIEQLDKNVEEVIEDEQDISTKEPAKSKWAKLGSRDLIVPCSI